MKYFVTLSILVSFLILNGGTTGQENPSTGVVQNDSDIVSFLETFWWEYTENIATKVPKEVRNELFLFYPNAEIIVVYNNNGDIAFSIRPTNRSETTYAIINVSDYNPVASLTERLIWIENSHRVKLENNIMNGRLVHRIFAMMRTDLTPELARAMANDYFSQDTRESLVQRAKKIAEKNPIYKPFFKSFEEHNKLMKQREKDEVYLGDIDLFKEDIRIFDELATQSGLSKEEAMEYKRLPVFGKELLGYEYENNWYYSSFFILLIIVAYFFGNILERISLPKWGEELYNYLSPIGIYAVSIYAKPYDYTVIQTVLPLFPLIGLFYYSVKKESKVDSQKQD